MVELHAPSGPLHVPARGDNYLIEDDTGRIGVINDHGAVQWHYVVDAVLVPDGEPVPAWPGLMDQLRTYARRPPGC